MCELSELSELSLGRELSPAIGDSSAGKICVISVVSAVRGCLNTLAVKEDEAVHGPWRFLGPHFCETGTFQEVIDDSVARKILPAKRTMRAKGVWY
jgi:hypothetical protein